jgi:WD40 repeat protein
MRILRLSALAALVLLSGCARRAAVPQQMEPTRTLSPRSAATTPSAATAAEPTQTPEAAQVVRSGLTRENVAALSERFVRRDRLPRNLYSVSTDRIGMYGRGAFETFDARTLTSIMTTVVELPEGSATYWYALSTDGRRGAIMRTNGLVELYDLDAGRRETSFEIGEISRLLTADIALDANGKTAVIIANGKLMRYDTGTGAATGEDQIISAGVMFVYFARDASRVALIDERGGIELLDTANGRMTSLARAVENVERISFSPDGKRLATANSTAVQIWDTGTGDEVWGIADLEEAISVAFPPRGDEVVLYGLSGGGVLYDIEAREPGEEVAMTGGGRIDSLEFSADGESILAQGGSTLERIDLRRMRSDALMRRFAATQGQWTPGGDLLVWSDRYENGEVLVLNGADGSTQHVLQHDAPVRGMIPVRSGRFAATSLADGSAYVWDIKTGERVAAIESEGAVRLLLCIDPAEEAVVYYEDGGIVSMPFDGAQDEQKFQQPFENLLDASYCDNDAGLVAFQDARAIEVMNLMGRTISTIDFGKVLTYGVGLKVSGNSRWVGGIVDDELVVWDASTGERAASRRLSKERERAQFVLHPHASLALLRDGSDYFLLNIETDKSVKLDVPESHVLLVGFPQDERLIVATSRVIDTQRPVVGAEVNFVSGALMVWDAETGKLLRTIETEDPVYSSVLSTDGKSVATFGYDGSLTMFTVE